jgi:hypothetical protein
VAKYLTTLLAGGGDDRHRCAIGQRRVEVGELTVHFSGERVLREAGAYRRSEVERR